MIYKNVRKIIQGIGTGKDFLKITFIIQEKNGNNWHMGPHKNKKKTCTAKEAVHWVQIYMAYRMVEDTVIHLAEY